MKTLDDLRKMREQVRKELDMRSGAKRARVTVCMGTCGIAAGARETMQAFLRELEGSGLGDIAVTAAGCAGFCEKEPMVEVDVKDEKPVRYCHVDAAAVARIVQEHLVGGKVVEDLVFG